MDHPSLEQCCRRMSQYGRHPCRWLLDSVAGSTLKNVLLSLPSLLPSCLSHPMSSQSNHSYLVPMLYYLPPSLPRLSTPSLPLLAPLLLLARPPDVSRQRSPVISRRSPALPACRPARSSSPSLPGASASPLGCCSGTLLRRCVPRPSSLPCVPGSLCCGSRVFVEPRSGRFSTRMVVGEKPPGRSRGLS